MFNRTIRTLLMHRLRTFLSSLGVLFGIVAVIAMLAIGEGAKQETLEQIQQLGLQNLIIRQAALSESQQSHHREHRSRGLSIEDMWKLREGVPTVTHFAPVKTIHASIEALSIAPEMIAVTRAFQEVKGLELLEGRFICDQDCRYSRQVCVVGYNIACCLGRKGHVDKTITINGTNYTIVGILKPMQLISNKNTLTNNQDLNKTILLPLKEKQGYAVKDFKPLSEIILQVEEKSSIKQIANVVHNVLKHAHYGQEDYQIIIPQALLEQANRAQFTFNLVLGSIAAISLLVGGIGIMNIMLASVSERTREIGIRRAIGATRHHILEQFLFEALLLTLLGAIAGVLIGILVALGITYLAGWKMIVTFWSIALSVGMALAVGLCSGIYPAMKAAHMHPIAALRHD